MIHLIFQIAIVVACALVGLVLYAIAIESSETNRTISNFKHIDTDHE